MKHTNVAHRTNVAHCTNVAHATSNVACARSAPSFDEEQDTEEYRYSRQQLQTHKHPPEVLVLEDDDVEEYDEENDAQDDDFVPKPDSSSWQELVDAEAADSIFSQSKPPARKLAGKSHLTLRR